MRNYPYYLSVLSFCLKLWSDNVNWNNCIRMVQEWLKWNVIYCVILLIIIINIRGQIENRPLENRCACAAGCKCICGPAADWFMDHHPMDFNQSGDFVQAGKPFTRWTFWSKRSSTSVRFCWVGMLKPFAIPPSGPPFNIIQQPFYSIQQNRTHVEANVEAACSGLWDDWRSHVLEHATFIVEQTICEWIHVQKVASKESKLFPVIQNTNTHYTFGKFLWFREELKRGVVNCNFVSISMTDANQFIIMLTTGDVHLHVTKGHLICVMTPQPSKKYYHRIWPYKGMRGCWEGEGRSYMYSI